MYEKMKSTMFKPGNIPPNKKNIGDIVLRADGYLCKKVLDKGMQKERFKLLHREIWEKHNGPVPDGMVIGFLDGNTENCDISNLFSISRELNLEMNRKRLRFERPEMTETGVNIAKLDIALRKKRGRRKK